MNEGANPLSALTNRYLVARFLYGRRHAWTHRPPRRGRPGSSGPSWHRRSPRRPAQPSRSGPSRAFAHAAFVWLVASAFVIAANSFAYDAARYRSGEAAVAMGYDARTVDAGYEWVGYHATGAEKSGSGAYNLVWYYEFWPSFRPCAVLSNSPLDGGVFRLIRVDRSAYLQYLFFGPAEPLYLYGALVDGCPPPPATVAAAKAPSSHSP